MTNRSCVIRLSRYKNALLRLKALNFVRVFSENLADAAGVSATQVRKIFSPERTKGDIVGHEGDDPDGVAHLLIDKMLEKDLLSF